MSRPNPYLLSSVLLAFVCLYGGFSVMQGGLYLDTHEADTYHLLDILFRMKSGLQPHVDFVTPIGVLAFLPVVLFMKSAFGVGISILLAQVTVALALWPFVAYAAASRLSRGMAYAFGLITLGLVLALTYGGAESGASISMHYNRWAWAISFTLLVLSILPPKGARRPLLEGILIGALASALLLIKVTYFASLLPVVAIAILWRGERGTFFVALGTGVIAVLAVALMFGVSHWTGYLADLVNVAGSRVRPQAGVPFSDIAGGPAYVGGSIVAILSVLLLRRSGREREAILLFLLLPAFLYITYQNFGNDPLWLLLLPALLLTLAPVRGQLQLWSIDAADGAIWLSIAALAMIFPSMVNLTLSPVNHAAIRSASFLPMLPERPEDRDIFIRQDRANTMTAEVYLDQTSPVWAKYATDAGREPELTIGGLTLVQCGLFAGSRAFLVEIAADLKNAGIPAGSQFFTTDSLTVFWLFGPFEPLEKGAPWYYGGLSGLENADYVLVPKCSFVSAYRRIIVEDLKAANVSLDLVRDTELYALFNVRR